MNNKIITVCDKENLWAMSLYIASVVLVFPFSNVILPFLIWALKKQESDFINIHGKNIINFEITIMVLFIAITSFGIFIGFSNSSLFYSSFPPFMVICVVILLFGIFLINLVTMLLGAIKAYQGKKYLIKYSFRFIK